jgi:hypothetical protein
MGLNALIFVTLDMGWEDKFQGIDFTALDFERDSLSPGFPQGFLPNAVLVPQPSEAEARLNVI